MLPSVRIVQEVKGLSCLHRRDLHTTEVFLEIKEVVTGGYGLKK
jgi:hypothetical protein